MLDFRMDTFLEVCRRMNFTRAAEELHITQPAVSQHIHWLEENYGAKLFDYQGKKLRLTEAGRMLLEAATTIKHDDIHLREQMTRLRLGGGRLAFGATRTIGSYRMPQPVAHYLKQFPDVAVRLVIANTQELLRQLNSGEIDFALVEGFFEKSEYDFLPYSREKYLAVCGPEYPCAGGTAEDLLNCRLILREPGSGTREVLEKYLEARNLTLRDFSRIVEVSSIDGIKALARANCGIAFLYEAAVQEELVSGRLREIPLADFPLTHDFNFIWRRGSIFANYYRELFRLLNPGPEWNQRRL